MHTLLFFVKTSLGYLLPFKLAIGLLVIGCILIWLTQRQRLGKLIVFLSTLTLVLFSMNGVAELLLSPLESQYPPIQTVNEASHDKALEKLSGVKYVVVLAGGAHPNPSLPTASNLTEHSLARLSEGIALHKIAVGSKLLLSGGSINGDATEALLMSKTALLLGVDANNIVLEEASVDTESQAENIKRIVGDEKFVLVTSAFHLPRSMGLFRRAGMNPLAAPTDYLSSPGTMTIRDFVPSAQVLRKSEIAFHEIIGLAWAKIRGKA